MSREYVETLRKLVDDYADAVLTSGSRFSYAAEEARAELVRAIESQELVRVPRAFLEWWLVLAETSPQDLLPRIRRVLAAAPQADKGAEKEKGNG